MELLKRAQSEFLLNAIAETYCKLGCANLLEQSTPITTLSNKLKLQKDALSRFLNTAAFLGMCQRSEDETYLHVTIKQFDKQLSPPLFHNRLILNCQIKCISFLTYYFLSNLIRSKQQ